MIDMAKTGMTAYQQIHSLITNDREVAKLIGVSYVAVRKWARGKNMPSIDNLAIISDVTGCKIDDLVVRR